MRSLYLRQLSDGELKTLALLVDAAEAGRPAPTADDIQEHTGCNSISSTVGFVQKLEKRGLISVERFQRSRRITILATGKRTAGVANQTPHWRSGVRPRATPSVPLSYVRSRKPDLARQILVAARQEGMSVQDFIGALVWAGWQARAQAMGESA
jgi:DNA-binding MarR family transcriptional regulator